MPFPVAIAAVPAMRAPTEDELLARHPADESTNTRRWQLSDDDRIVLHREIVRLYLGGLPPRAIIDRLDLPVGEFAKAVRAFNGRLRRRGC
jgi:hypothetical protein